MYYLDTLEIHVFSIVNLYKLAANVILHILDIMCVTYVMLFNTAAVTI